MEKNLEKSLKRFLKRKVKITMGLVVSFLITGMVSFAEGNTKGADKKAEVKNINGEEYIINEEILKNILSRISVGNIHIIESGESTGTQNIDGYIKIGINNGTIANLVAVGQNISNGFGINNKVGIFGINNGEIIVAEIGQNISSNNLGINNGAIRVTSVYSSDGQKINGGLGINYGIIYARDAQNIADTGIGINNGVAQAVVAGQSIWKNSLGINNNIMLSSGQTTYYESSFGINNGDIIAQKSNGQRIYEGLGINNGIITTNEAFGKGQEISDGLGINNGVIATKEEYQVIGISVWGNGKGGTGINNGIVISSTPYNIVETFYNNGIALKRNNAGTLVLNNGTFYNNGSYEDCNKNIDILGKDKLTGNFSEVIKTLGEKKDVGETSDGTKIKGYNIFINNLGVDDQGNEDTNNKNNQLVIDTNLSEDFANTHITTAVGNDGNIKTEGIIKIADGLNNFLMDKSTIIGHFEQDGTLVDMNGAENITLSDSVISANGKETDTTNHIFLKPTAIKFAEGSIVTLNNSIVNGKMDFLAGKGNTLNLKGKYNGNDKNTYKDGTQFMTSVNDVSFGAGDDIINVEIQKGTGDEINRTGKGFVNLGKVDFGAGNDTLKFSFEDYKSGHFSISGEKDIEKQADGNNFIIKEHHGIDFGDGDDKIVFSDVLDMEKYTELDGTTVTTNTAVEKNIVMLNNLLSNKSMPVNSLETLQLADNGGNVFYFEGNGVSLDFKGKILGGKGEDTFVIPLDKLTSYNFNGGEGTDYIRLTEKYDENRISSFENLSDKSIEGLKLGDFENTVDIDNLLADDEVKLTHLKGGNTGDTFIINGNKVLGMTISGGNSSNDILKVNTEITTKELSNKTGIEKLELGLDVAKPIDFEIDFTDKNLKDFKDIKSGKGDDIFTVSVNDIENIKIDGGGTVINNSGIQISRDHDKLKLSGVLNNTEQGKENILSGVSNIEELQLDNEKNILNLDIVNGFKNITGGNDDDTFKISALRLPNISINGGIDKTNETKGDILELTSAVTGNADFSRITNIENLQLNNEENTLNLNNANGFKNIYGGTGNDIFIIQNQADYSKVFGGDGKDKIKFTGNFDNTKDDIVSSIFSTEKGFESIDFLGKENNININGKFTDKTFYFNGQTNNINIKNEISAENLVFGNGTNNVILEESGNISGEVKFTNGSSDTLTVNKNNGEFDLNVNGAEKIVLGGASGEWKFKYGSLITGNTNLDLKNNTLNLLDNEKNISASDKIINSGNIKLEKGNLVLGDLNFIGEKSNVTVSNGTIKIGFDKSVKFAEGVNTEFTLSLGEKLSLGENVDFETYSFINEIGKDLKVTVKKWEDYDEVKNNKDYLLYGKRYDESLKKYNTAGNEALTNAFNIFGSDTVVDYIVNGTNPKLLYESDNGKYEVLIAESGEDIIIKTSETETDKDTALTFNNISSTGKITVAVTEGTNEITFGDKTNSQSSVSIKGENGIDFSTSATAVTINIAGEKINDITKIIANNSNNTINLSGKNISVDEISLGTGDNTINISDISNITSLGTVTGEGENIIDIENKITDESSYKFMELLKNENLTGISQINLEEDNKITIDNDYSFDKNINLSSNNNITVTNGTLKADNLKFSESGNKVILNGGNMTGTLSFAEGQKENVFEVNKTEGIFNYGIKNANEIKLSGADEWKFENGAEISGNKVAVNVENGTIVFTAGIKNNFLALGKDGVNPFAETGNYIINGNIKLTFDDTLKFNSASDLENIFIINKSNISLGQEYKVSVPEFLNYKDGEISVKSADDLGIDKIAHGNYEHLLTKYYNKGNNTVTEMFNTNSAEDIKNKVEKSIFDELHLYSFNGTKDNLLTLNKVYIETNEKGEKTNVVFNNISAADEFKINISGTENNISLLGNVSFEKGINGSNSEGVINLSLGGRTINLHDNAVVLGKNNDTLNLLSSINGTLDGFEGENILNIGENKPTEKVSDKNSQKEIVLDGEIKNFKEINLNQDTKLNSDLKFADKNESEKVFSETEKINLNGNNLILGVDETKVSGEKDNKPIITGHALYDKGIEVNNENGQIVIDVNGKTFNSFISMGDENKTTFTDENNFTTNSVNFEVEYDKDNGLVNLHTKEHFLGKDEIIKYAHLDKIYQSIASAGDKILLMNPSASTENKTKDEAIKAQLEFYGKIYHSTPYAYSNDVSKKSADLITESIMNLKVMPEYKHWVFGGSIAGQEADSNSNFYGSNHYNGIDIGKNEISADTNIYGAYAFGKYGIGVNQSVGFALAGTRSDTDISGNSKLEGDAVYISAFAEQEINNLKLTAGISYQHSFYDSTRNVSNDYQRMSVDKKYEDDLISVFAGGKYSYHLGNNFFAEPKVKLSVTHVMQNSIDEGDNGKLTIETDKKDFTFVEGEVGIDLVKKVNLSKGTLSLKAGTSLVYSIEGYEEEYLTGRITGSSKDFEMISPEDDRTRVKFTVGTEYEMTNGMFMNLHGNYTTSSHAEDYAVSFGAGYRF